MAKKDKLYRNEYRVYKQDLESEKFLLSPLEIKRSLARELISALTEEELGTIINFIVRDPWDEDKPRSPEHAKYLSGLRARGIGLEYEATLIIKSIK